LPLWFARFSRRFADTWRHILRAIIGVLSAPRTQGVFTMEWTTPQHEEIDLNCEVSSYANAEL
jgi:hypothetical protein